MSIIPIAALAASIVALGCSNPTGPDTLIGSGDAGGAGGQLEERGA